MAYSKFLAVLLGSQLSFTVNSIDKSGHGSIRLHHKNNHNNNDEPLLRVVNKTRILRTKTRPRFKKLSNNKNNNNNDKLETLSQVTALFSNTFYNIFNFREKRPAPASPEEKEEVQNVVFKNENNDNNLARDYAAAYEDYISSFLGSDLESAVNGDGNSEYYYSDDYIDYEFDSISQIEDTTTKNKHDIQNSKKEVKNSPEKKHLDKYPVQPVVLFSIALTLFGLLQIIMARKISNSETSSCYDNDEENNDFIVVNSDSDENFKNSKNIIILKSNPDSPPSSLDKIDEEPLNV